MAGYYLHGLFENGRWRRQWLNQLREARGLSALPLDVPHHTLQREGLLDRLADAFEAEVNLAPLLNASVPHSDGALPPSPRHA